MADRAVADELITELDLAGGTPGTPVSPVAITWTASNPSYTATGALTIANGSTPTVVELQKFCLELLANVTQIQALLHAHGITT
jgi:hypothetical protein